MTTIIIDCEGQAVYADSCRTQQRYSSKRSTIPAYILNAELDMHLKAVRRDKATKVHKVREDIVIVGCGDSSLIDNFVTFWPKLNYVRMEEELDFRIFVVQKREKGFVIDEYTPKVYPKTFFTKETYGFNIESYTKTNGHITAGSGSAYAMGALKAGKKPAEAIKIASICDPSTDGNVDSVKL